nr:integrase, catalytic region, zinc finger, CCHC-type, peptidase aspartic, catalytic [Tanacetum cinerariifolium]
NGLIGVPGNANQNLNGNGNLVAARDEGNAAGHNKNQIRCYNCRGVGHFSRNCTVRPRSRDAAYLQTQILIAQKEEAGIQLQAEKFDLMAATADIDGIEKYIELLEPIPKPLQVLQNDNNVTSEVTSVEHSEETIEQHHVNVEETPKFVGDFKSLAKEADDSLAKKKDLELEIGRLLRAVVSVQKDITRGTSKNTNFAKQSILGKPPMLGEIHALSKPVTSNSVFTPQESKVMNNDKQCLISVNHDVSLRNYVKGKTSRSKKQKANVSIKEKQKKHYPKVMNPKKVGFIERLATPKPSKLRFLLRWSPIGRLFDQKGTVRFENDHVAVILVFGDLQWGNILITRVYFVVGLGHNLFSVGKFCDSDLE